VAIQQWVEIEWCQGFVAVINVETDVRKCAIATILWCCCATVITAVKH